MGDDKIILSGISNNKAMTINTTIDGNVLSVDKALICFLGLALERFADDVNFQDCFLNKKDFLTIYNEVKLNEYCHSFETQLKTIDDLTVWVRICSILEKDKNGEIKSVKSIISDISLEQDTKEKLLDSEAKNSALSRAAYEAIIFSDKGICIEANEAACQMFGYTYDDFIGVFGTDVIADESKELVKEHILSGYENPYEATAIKKNGQTFPAEFQGKMFRYKEKNIRVTAVRDLSERKKTQDLLKKNEIEKLQNQEKSKFLSHMSHEIRTPMHAVHGLTKLLQQTKLTDKQNDYVKKIETSAISLLRIVNDILDITKIEAGKMTLEKVEFKLSDVLDNLKNILSIKAQEKPISLIFDVDPSIPDLLIGDHFRLEQVLLNLLNNSIKFTVKGNVWLKITILKDIGLEGDNQIKLDFKVSDTGIGMTNDEVKHIFNPFIQADSSSTRKYGGTGLGLTICKNLIQLLGGEINIKTTPNEGTCIGFSSVFNIVSEKAEPNRSQMESMDLSSNDQIIDESNIDKKKVLVVEDNEINKMIIVEFLELEGFLVQTVSNGNDAISILEKCNNDSFDIILMDIQIPDYDGHQLTKLIRNKFCLKEIPIIAMTAYALKNDIEKCIASGMNDHVSKPFAFEEVITKINFWIKKRNKNIY